MKNLLFALLTVAQLSLFAQTDFNMQVAKRACSKGNYPSYQLDIPQTHLAQTKGDWMAYLKKGSKGKPVEVNGEVQMLGAVNPNISPSPFNVYSAFLETTTGVRLTAWIALNDSVFISDSTSDRGLAVEKYLHDFAAGEYRGAIKVELKAENNKLKKLQDDLDDLYKQQEKSVKKSEELKRSIDRNNDKINTNATDEQNKRGQIANQKQIVEDLKSNPGATLDAARKTQKGYEGELQKLVNNEESYHKQIDKWSADIRDQDRNTADIVNSQNLKKADIDKQSAAVKAVQDKLNAIQ